ncbi:hypothetical protein MMPV_003842 [Pyropia vietnamensis]
MPTPADAIVLLLDAGASTVAWARDVLPAAEVDAALGGGLAAAANGVGAMGTPVLPRPADSTAPPPNPRVFDVLRSAAMRLVATRFCYYSKQDRMGLVVMGQPVDSNEAVEDGGGASGSDDDEEETGGDTSTSHGGEHGGIDGEEAAEDSASLVHPVVKVTFDLMRKLRELPISGAETVFRDGIVRAGGHMMVMTANTKLTRRILLFTDARTTCTDEDEELLIEAVGAMHTEGVRLDVVIPGLATLPEYDGDEEAWEEAPEGEDDGSDGESAAGSSSPAGGECKRRKHQRGAPPDSDGRMDVEQAATAGANHGSQESEEDEEQEEVESVSNPILSRAFAPDDVDAEVRARLEHSAAAGGMRKTEAHVRNEALLRRAAAVTGGMSLSMAALIDYLSEPRKRSVRAVAKYAGTLSLSPSVHIPVRAYTATAEVRLPTCKRLSWARTLEAGHHVVAARQTTFSTLDKPDETLDEEDIMPAYAYGSDIVPVSAEVDAALVRCASGPKSLRVLGFVPLTAIPQAYFLSSVDAVVAMGEVPESRASLAALATAMRRCKRGAIARLVNREDAAPQLKFLWADQLPAVEASDSGEEDDDWEDSQEAASGRARRHARPFLYMVTMPLADGIRTYTFPSMQPKLDILTTQKRDAVDALFHAYDMDAPSTTDSATSAMRDDDDDDEDGTPESQNSDAMAKADCVAGRALDCAAIFNPAIHLFFAATVQRALDGVTGTALPALPPALSAPMTPVAYVRDSSAATAAVGRFAELLPTRRVDPRSVRKEREYFAANRDGSKQLLGAFLPDEYGDTDDNIAAETDLPEAANSRASTVATAAASSTEAMAVTEAADPPSTVVVPSSADGPMLPKAAQSIDVRGAEVTPSVAATAGRDHHAVAHSPTVALSAAVEEASEITAAPPVGGPSTPIAVAPAPAAATAGAPTRPTDDAAPRLLGDSDDEDDGGGGFHGSTNGVFDVRALRAQIEATQLVSDSQAESHLFSYATRTTGRCGAAATPGGITNPPLSNDSAAAAAATATAAAPPPPVVCALGADDPVADFAAMLANADADAQVAAEMLTDTFRSRVRAGDASGAAAALRALRTGCVTACIGDEFNRAARKLLAAARATSPFLAHPAVAFLGHLFRTPATEGGGLDVLRLVTEAEGGGHACAGVTPAVVTDFARHVAAAAAREVSAPPRLPSST